MSIIHFFFLNVFSISVHLGKIGVALFSRCSVLFLLWEQTDQLLNANRDPWVKTEELWSVDLVNFSEMFEPFWSQPEKEAWSPTWVLKVKGGMLIRRFTMWATFHSQTSHQAVTQSQVWKKATPRAQQGESYRTILMFFLGYELNFFEVLQSVHPNSTTKNWWMLEWSHRNFWVPQAETLAFIAPCGVLKKPVLLWKNGDEQSLFLLAIASRISTVTMFSVGFRGQLPSW